MTKVAMIGSGDVYSCMCAALVEAGHQIAICEFGALSSAAELNGSGRAERLSSAVRDAEVVIILLSRTDDVRELLFGGNGVVHFAATGAVLVNCSTMEFDASEELAKRANGHGFVLLDAPVLGSNSDAKRGDLTFLVGGPNDEFLAVSPLMHCMGNRVIRMGDAGKGQAAKSIVSMLLAVSMIGNSEVIYLSERLGLDSSVILSAASFATDSSDLPLCDAPDDEHQLKISILDIARSLELATYAARKVKAPLNLGKHAQGIYSGLLEDGYGHLPLAAVMERIKGRI